MLALLLFLSLALATVLLGFLAAVRGGGHAAAALSASRRIVELSAPAAADQAPPDSLSSI